MLNIVKPSITKSRTSFDSTMGTRLNRSLNKFFTSEKRSNVFSIDLPLDHSARLAIIPEVRNYVESLGLFYVNSVLFDVSPTTKKRYKRYNGFGRSSYSAREPVMGLQYLTVTIDLSEVADTIEGYIKPTPAKGLAKEATSEDYEKYIRKWADYRFKPNMFCNTEKEVGNSSESLALVNARAALKTLGYLGDVPLTIVRRDTVREEWFAVIDFSNFK